MLPRKGGYLTGIFEPLRGKVDGKAVPGLHTGVSGDPKSHLG